MTILLNEDNFIDKFYRNMCLYCNTLIDTLFIISFINSLTTKNRPQIFFFLLYVLLTL